MKTKHKYILSLSLFSLFLGSLAFYIYQQSQNFQTQEVSEPGAFPNIAFYDDNNRELNLDNTKAKVSLISFWATWCAPCIVEIPMFQKLYQDFKERGFTVIPINLDDSMTEAEPLIQRLWKKNKITFNTYYDFEKKSASQLNLAGLPSNFLIDENKQIIFESQGLIDWNSNEIRKMIEESLAN